MVNRKPNTFFFLKAMIGLKIRVASFNFKGFEKWPIGEHHFPHETNNHFEGSCVHLDGISDL